MESLGKGTTAQVYKVLKVDKLEKKFAKNLKISLK
jgi:hypothetical protein